MRKKSILIMVLLVALGCGITLWWFSRQTYEEKEPGQLLAPNVTEVLSQSETAQATEQVQSPPAAVTDIAPTATKIAGVTRRDLPESIDTTSPQTQSTKLPTGVMDLAAPPQWTRPLALPVANPEPPDPLKSPPLHVNPERVPEPDIPRLSPGVYVPVNE